MKIKKVKVKNFKSLKDVEIELKGLTLITGVNSGGKSSFLQSMLLLKQNEDKFYSTKRKKIININGYYVKLGNKKDILFEEAYDENIEITISSDEKSYKLSFEPTTLKMYENSLLDDRELFNIFYDNFQYISTDRVSPNISYTLSQDEIEKGLIGIKGEYTAHYLANNIHQKLNIENLKHSKAVTNHLLENASLWLSEISRGIRVNAKVFDELQQVNLTYSYIYGKDKTREYTPLNVGFGITYSLPIIVAILKAKRGDLVIIENPESHLHPAGQAKIANLIVLAVANGVDVIVESHSDHFLNAIRVATKKGIISSDNSVIYYFDKDENSIETKITKLTISKDGKINESWPKGFFDEYENLLDELLW